jgi:putative hydrolase of the HAD superfamily
MQERNKKKEYKFIFFDLDNTLWDFKRNSQTTLKELLDEFVPEIAPAFADFYQTYTQVNDKLWLQYRNGEIKKEYLRNARFKLAFEKLGINNPKAVKQVSDGYVEQSPMKTGVFPYTYDVLEYLKRKGYKLYLLTNGFKEVQDVKVKNCKLEGFIHKMFTSEQCGYQKPNRKAFEFAIKSANAKKSQSLMIGDDQQADILGAKLFGIDQVWFNPENKRSEVPATYTIESLIDLKLIL